MSWFEELVGFAEQSPQQVRANLQIVDHWFVKSKVSGGIFRCGRLQIPSLHDLRQQTAKRLQHQAGEAIAVSEVVGDVQQLHQARENNGALFQVASQFNLLEMMGPQVSPEQGVGIYEYDRTQGPACAIACGAATIFRNYFAEVDGAPPGQYGQTVDKQIDCLRDLGAALNNDGNRLWRMRNGYALACRAGLLEIAGVLGAADEATLDTLRGKLRIGAQHEAGVTLGYEANVVTQALCSAMPVAYSEHSATLWEPLARLVLEAAYEATLHLGVLNQQRSGSPRVFLTLLGGGAFGNRTEWIISAIERALRKFANSGLDVRIVSYGGSQPEVSAVASRCNANRASRTNSEHSHNGR